MSCESIEETPKKQPTKETTDPKNQTTVPKETVSPTPGLIPELPKKVVKVTTGTWKIIE